MSWFRSPEPALLHIEPLQIPADHCVIRNPGATSPRTHSPTPARPQAVPGPAPPRRGPERKTNSPKILEPSQESTNTQPSHPFLLTPASSPSLSSIAARF